MLLKTIGSILILCVSAAIGLSKRSQLARHVNILKGLISAFEIIHSEISCMCTATEELLERLCNIASGEVKCFFDDCLDGLRTRRDLPFALIWSRSVKDAGYLELSHQESEALLELGNSLGRYNADETLRALNYAIRNFEGYLKAASDTRARLGKLYGNLSIIAGIALVIILI